MSRPETTTDAVTERRLAALSTTSTRASVAAPNDPHTGSEDSRTNRDPSRRPGDR